MTAVFVMIGWITFWTAFAMLQDVSDRVEPVIEMTQPHCDSLP